MTETRQDKDLTPSWLVHPAFQLLVLVFTIGMAWAALTAAVANKADKADLTAVAAVEKGKAEKTTVDSLRIEIHDVNIQLRAIHGILCGQYPHDSYCQPEALVELP